MVKNEGKHEDEREDVSVNVSSVIVVPKGRREEERKGTKKQDNELR
jgi:hypothetical protein